jgi:hypothetical protein
MANNVQATAGSGTTFKTTDTAGVHVGHVNVDTIAAGTNAIGKLAANSGVDIGDVDVTSVPTDPFGANADAASATGSISAKLKAIATALGVTAFDLGSGTGGSRTLRLFQDTAQWIGGAGAVTAATQRVTLPSDDPAVAVLGTTADAASVSTSISAKLRAIATAIGTAVITRGAGAADSGTLRVTMDSGQMGALGQATAANSVPSVHASDRENSVGFAVAMSTDTSAYASGDLIADTQQLDAFFNKTDGCGVINSITIIDQDAQGVALYVLFHKTSTSMGTENSAPNISDANAVSGIQGIVAVATTDYVTVSGTKVACIKNIGLPVKAVSGTDDLYVSVLNATGTPTFTATGLNLIIGGLLD